MEVGEVWGGLGFGGFGGLVRFGLVDMKPQEPVARTSVHGQGQMEDTASGKQAVAETSLRPWIDPTEHGAFAGLAWMSAHAGRKQSAEAVSS